jgi:hypothetical protein
VLLHRGQPTDCPAQRLGLLEDSTIFIATDEHFDQKLVFLHIKTLLEERD